MAIVAEADRSIGTGHVVESVHVAAAATALGLDPVVVVPRNVPTALLRTGAPIERLDSLSPAELSQCAHGLRSRGAAAAITNLRRIDEAQVTALQDAGLQTFCIDEFGGRPLPCAAVFNPTPLVGRHQYGSGAGAPGVYAGPAYLPIAPEYRAHRDRPRRFDRAIRSVVVSMGGVDRTGASLRLIEALDMWEGDADRHLVLGSGFPFVDRVTAVVAASRRPWHVHRSLPSLAALCAEADVAFTAGGNTLYELACLGTPAVVLHEDPHEEEQAKAFEACGFGIWLGSGIDTASERVIAALERLGDPLRREQQCCAGRALVDGRGADRICEIVQRTTWS